MKHPGRLQSPSKSRLIVTLTLLAFVPLLALLVDRLPGAFDRLVPGPVQWVAAGEASEPQAQTPKAEASHNEVIIYITSWCPACRMTMDYMKDKKIPFVAKDVEKNEQYMKEMVRKVGGYRGVPVLDINGRILLGFNPQVLDQLAR